MIRAPRRCEDCNKVVATPCSRWLCAATALLGVVAGIAERVIVMYAGFVVEDAMVDELYGNPLHPYTLALLKSLPRLDGLHDDELATIEGLPPSLLDCPDCCPFEPRCEFAKEKCREINPLLEEVEPGHKIACWVDVKTGELR